MLGLAEVGHTRFAIEPSAQVQREVQRIARGCLDRALSELDGLDAKGAADIEAAVHSVRKRGKEVRALARLVREPLGVEWSAFNAGVRDASNELSSIRDAHAVLATLDDLLRACGMADDPDLDAVRSVFAEAAAAATIGIRGHDRRIEKARELLLQAHESVGLWSIDEGSAWLVAGFSNTYGRGQRALKRARKRPTDDRMHELRKRVKTLWYQVRLIEASAPSVLIPLVAQLHQLGDALGDDHDLAVLVGHMEGQPERFGGEERANRVVALARSQQDDLRRRAFRLGDTVYAETTTAFVARIEHYWRTTVEYGPELRTGKIAELAAD